MAKTNTKPKRLKPLLSLDTLVVRRTVVIDGGVYEVLSPSELSIIDHHRLARKGTRLEELLAKADASDAELEEIGKTLDELCRYVLKAPDDVHKKLTDTHRLLVTQAFTELLMETVRPAGAKVTEEGPKSPTGESTSPD
ncbi:hypothetical protein LCGC14_1435010 [marine sediment metagenome]|uniref:Uncharacterized protein n=1 Tax=marine sediment metagenome TaxID=412755 RepID=A0A0F9JMY9_9ZZZZ